MATLRTSRGASLSRKTCRRWHWTQEEDDLLTSLVQMHGPGKWDQIATHIPGRSGKSCRIRWLNQLHPGVDKKPFSVEEKQRLLVLHRKLGNKWAVIVHYFPGRTDNQVKNQYHILAGTRKSAPFPPRNDPHVPLDNESRGLFQNPSISMVDSHFSGVTSLGTNYHGSAPMVGVMPGLISSSSSVYGMGGYLTQVGTVIPSSFGPRPSYDNSMTSDANSASVGGYEFMDFFRVGLGSSD